MSSFITFLKDLFLASLITTNILTFEYCSCIFLKPIEKRWGEVLQFVRLFNIYRLTYLSESQIMAGWNWQLANGQYKFMSSAWSGTWNSCHRGEGLLSRLDSHMWEETSWESSWCISWIMSWHVQPSFLLKQGGEFSSRFSNWASTGHHFPFLPPPENSVTDPVTLGHMLIFIWRIRFDWLGLGFS